MNAHNHTIKQCFFSAASYYDAYGRFPVPCTLATARASAPTSVHRFTPLLPTLCSRLCSHLCSHFSFTPLVHTSGHTSRSHLSGASGADCSPGQFWCSRIQQNCIVCAAYSTLTRICIGWSFFSLMFRRFNPFVVTTISCYTALHRIDLQLAMQMLCRISA